MPAGIVGGGSECSALSPPSIPWRGALEQATEPPTAPRAPQHKWLPTAPGLCSLCVCVCVFTAVCVHLGWVNCRAWIRSMSRHFHFFTFLYTTVLRFGVSKIYVFFFFLNKLLIYKFILFSFIKSTSEYIEKVTKDFFQIHFEMLNFWTLFSSKNPEKYSTAQLFSTYTGNNDI